MFNFIIKYRKNKFNFINILLKRFNIIKLNNSDDNNNNFLFILRRKLRN